MHLFQRAKKTCHILFATILYLDNLHLLTDQVALPTFKWNHLEVYIKSSNLHSADVIYYPMRRIMTFDGHYW